MTPLVKGLVIAAVDVGLVSSLGAKLLYDRATRPRVWARAVPYDPNLPIRGRYVSLQLVVESRGVREIKPGLFAQQPVTVSVESGKLVAAAEPKEGSYAASDLHVLTIRRQEQTLAVLDKSVAVFIPEHVPDPSLRRPDEELWVEVTVPKKGPPRPIRLGIKKGDGPIVPLEFEMEARAPPVPVSQHRKKIPVAVSHSGEDKAAGELTLALTEAIGASQSFRLVDHEWNPSTPRILVMVHSAAAVSPDASISTVKTSISYKDRVAMQFLTGLEQNCDRNRMEDCAKRILSKIDKEVEWLRENGPVLWETL